MDVVVPVPPRTATAWGLPLFARAAGVLALTAVLAAAAGQPQPRIAGADRWETAAQLARATAGDRAGSVKHVLLANGDAARSGVDALSASYLSGALEAPVVLTGAASLAPSTLLALTDLFGASPVPGATLHVVGGVAAVPDAQVAALAAELPGVSVVRTQGGDRYDTARAVALEGAAVVGVPSHQADAAANPLRTVLLASGTNPTDALIAGQVAHAGGYPVLLTAPGALPTATATALEELGADQVLVLGGPAAVSEQVTAALAAAGQRVVRVAGADRYETAAALLTRASAPVGGQTGGMGLGFAAATSGYLISGLNPTDAIAASALAGTLQRPLLLTTPTELDGATGAWLGASRVTSVTGIGGPQALSEDLLTAVNAVLGAPVEP